jgi:hypothetical protein
VANLARSHSPRTPPLQALKKTEVTSFCQQGGSVLYNSLTRSLALSPQFATATAEVAAGSVARGTINTCIIAAG